MCFPQVVLPMLKNNKKVIFSNWRVSEKADREQGERDRDRGMACSEGLWLEWNQGCCSYVELCNHWAMGRLQQKVSWMKNKNKTIHIHKKPISVHIWKSPDQWVWIFMNYDVLIGFQLVFFSQVSPLLAHCSYLLVCSADVGEILWKNLIGTWIIFC